MRAPDFLPRLGYRHPDQDDDPRPDPFMAADFALTKAIAEVIERHYFGHPFKVVVDHRQGVVQIQIPALMPATSWHVVHISALASDPDMRLIVRGCGEILERYNLPRFAYDRDEFIAAIKSVPVIQKATGHGRVPS